MDIKIRDISEAAAERLSVLAAQAKISRNEFLRQHLENFAKAEARVISKIDNDMLLAWIADVIERNSESNFALAEKLESFEKKFEKKE